MKAVILLTMLMLLVPVAEGSLVVGRVDDFEDGIFQEWTGGAEYANIATGGPAGIDDNYLEMARTLVSFHLGAQNTTTWAGDYLAAGVKAIEMDVNPMGPADLSLRIMLFGPGGNFSTTVPMPITTGGGWQHIAFGLSPSDLVHVTGSISANAPDGPGILIDTLADVTTILIRHDPDPTPNPPGWHPQHVLSVLGVDNIEAVLGPAPSHHVAWKFDNAASRSYILDSFEPNDIALAALGAEDPVIMLYLNKRYQVTVLNHVTHPFEVISKGASSETDTVLLSMSPGVVGLLETDADVAWDDNSIGTAAFTMTQSLYDAMIVSGDMPGYRCAAHSGPMRGDFKVCMAPIKGDGNGDCNIDFADLALFALNWLTNNVAP